MTSQHTRELNDLLEKIATNTHEHSDTVRLMELGREHGFGSIANRKKIWPVLLEVNIDKLQKSTDFLDWRKDPDNHSEDYDQLKKDAMRSFFSLKAYQNMDQHYLKKKQEDLLELLDAFSKNQPRFKYFQGFHDVVSVFIGIFGSNVGYYISHRVATTYLRDTFLYSFQQTVSILDKLIYFITIKRDPQFQQLFEEFQEQRLGFTMPWIITWFAHSFDDINVITRIWDYLISSQASAIVYASAALILETKQSMLEHCQGSYDLGTIHSFYQRISKVNVDIDRVIRTAIDLEREVALSTIPQRDSLPSEYFQLLSRTVMKEENFVQLIRLHELYRSTQQRKQANKKRVKQLLIISGLVGLALWSYSVYGRRLFGRLPGGL